MPPSPDPGDRSTRRLPIPAEPQLVPMPAPPEVPLWLRRWQRVRLVTLGVVGAVVLITGIVTFVTVLGAARTVVSGNGERLLNAVNRSLMAGVDEATLAAVVAENESVGLRGITVLAPGGGVHTHVGVPPTEGMFALMRPREPYPTDDLVWMLHRPPRMPGTELIATPQSEPGPPPPGLESRPGLPERPPPPPAFAIAYQPVEAQTLRRAALVALVAGIVAALMLAASAYALRAIQRRLDAIRAADERARHLAALGEMSAVVAHEIRNPLAGLKGSAQLLVEALPEDQARNRARAERVVREALRIESLTADLLSLVRSREVLRQRCSPAELLQDAAASVDPGRVRIEDGAPPTWSLDPDRMLQALRNLMENALHASPDGAVAQARVADGALEITVRDFGPGVPADQRERIFEAFTTGRAQGTGLGLAVTRRIVELHGGRITVTDHPDGGAVFRMSIPPGPPGPNDEEAPWPAS